jgi:hypothetical protein
LAHSLSFQEIQELQTLNAQARYDYLLAQAAELQTLWILVGDGGSVLLSNSGQECVPVWPSEQLAESHINGDWEDCKCHAISVDDWLVRWTEGLTEDGFSVAGFIDEFEEGIIVSAEEFHDDLLAVMQEDE